MVRNVSMYVCTGYVRGRCGRAMGGFVSGWCVVDGARAMAGSRGDKGVEDAMATAVRRSLCFFEWLRKGTGRIV